MPAALEPIKAFKCTYPNCKASFDTEKAMKNHKKYSEEHDYCHKCNEDFDSPDDLAQHKAVRPDNHGKACRVCGEEFKCTSGLKRHIELNHKVDQKLPCVGCGAEFYRASLLIEHLEFGYCPTISASQFQGHIVHKHLISELLKGGAAYDRFMQKIAKFDATQDFEDEGGVDLDGDMLEHGGEEVKLVKFEAIKPEDPVTPLPYSPGPYPPLPLQRRNFSERTELASTLEKMSLNEASDSSTVVGSTTQDSKTLASSNRQLKVWQPRDGKSASQVLFAGAQPTPPPSEFSISAHDERMEHEHGINIMSTRFWDPMSGDWNPERFFDSIVSKYYCPFICEQSFPTAGDMNAHILHDHRITRMKCPSCLKYFKSCTALMSHCESRGSKCQINKAEDFNIFLDKLTGGFLAVEEKTRPDHLHNPAVMIKDSETGKMERYQPPVASYLQYTATKPPDYKEPPKQVFRIGGGPQDYIEY